MSESVHIRNTLPDGIGISMLLDTLPAFSHRRNVAIPILARLAASSVDTPDCEFFFVIRESNCITRVHSRELLRMVLAAHGLLSGSPGAAERN